MPVLRGTPTLAGHNEEMAVAEVYRAYEALIAGEQGANGLGGSLLVVARLDPRNMALATAANIAGAATLALEDDPRRAREAVRAGVCDFMVTNLDEALRILKNELRKKKPVSVVLDADPVTTLAEAVERGVRSEFISSEELALLGGRIVREVPPDRPVEVRWSVPQGKSQSLVKVDLLAAAAIGEAAAARRRWLSQAARYVGRPMLTERYVRMDAAELERFRTQVQGGIREGSLPDYVTLQWS